MKIKMPRLLSSLLIALFVLGLFLPVLVPIFALGNGTTPMHAMIQGIGNRFAPGILQFYGLSGTAYVLFALGAFIKGHGAQLDPWAKALGYVAASALLLVAAAIFVYVTYIGAGAEDFASPIPRTMLGLEVLTDFLNALILLFAAFSFFSLHEKGKPAITLLFCLGLFALTNCFGLITLAYHDNIERLIGSLSLSGAMIFLRSFAVLSLAIILAPEKPRRAKESQA